MPVYVYFVDAAWAPYSAEGCPETDRSSLLVIMHQILEKCLAKPDPDLRAVYQALYGVFRDAFTDIIGLILPQDSQLTPGDLFDPSPVTSETDFDGYDPDDLDLLRREDDEADDVYDVYEDEEVA